MGLWRCAGGCGEFWDDPGPCRTCWSHTTIPVPARGSDGQALGSPGARPYRRRYKPTTGLDVLLRTARSPKLLEWGSPNLLLPLNTSVLCTGQPGSGKTTFATRVAVRLALLGVSVLWISAEEGAGPTTAARFARVLGWFGNPSLPKDNLMISDRRLLRDVHAEIMAFEAKGPGFVAIDSVTALGAAPQMLEQLAAGPLGFFAIAQVNGRGSAWGGPRQAHDVDVVLTVEDYAVTITKSRWYDERTPRSWPVDEPVESVDQDDAGSNVVSFRGGAS